GPKPEARADLVLRPARPAQPPGRTEVGSCTDTNTTRLSFPVREKSRFCVRVNSHRSKEKEEPEASSLRVSKNEKLRGLLAGQRVRHQSAGIYPGLLGLALPTSKATSPPSLRLGRRINHLRLLLRLRQHRGRGLGLNDRSRNHRHLHRSLRLDLRL